jgi:hypothetical protein
MKKAEPWNIFSLSFLLVALSVGPSLLATGKSVCNVKDYGASGKKADDARPAIQKAIDACAAAGGGVVYVPPGKYTSGTLHLRSHVRFEIEAGATLFASSDPNAYEYGKIASKAALFYGEDLENISIGGRGIVDGQAEYEWRPDDFERAFDHKTLMQTLGKSLQRSFPKGFPKREVFPHLVWLGRSKDVQITGLKFLHSPSWTIALYACERTAFDGLHIYSSLKEAVWADGIDLDGCKDVFISNCTIETGDDCIVFISQDVWGPALACENVTVTNCRLSSASAGIKFSEGNRVGIRKILVSNTLFAQVNRGLVFSITLGGYITDVMLSNLTIDCRRFDWFWAGDGQPFHFRITRVSELTQEPPQPGEPPPGSIRNVVIRDVIAHAKGSSPIHGHAESWLDGISFENIKLFLAADPAAPFDRAEHALHFRWARNLKIKDVEVFWQQPALENWKSALCLEDINDLVVDGFAGRGAWPDRDVPAVVLNKVSDAIVRHSRALDGTQVFLQVMGQDSRNIYFHGNDLRRAKVPWRLEEGVKADTVKILENSLPQ